MTGAQASKTSSEIQVLASPGSKQRPRGKVLLVWGSFGLRVQAGRPELELDPEVHVFVNFLLCQPFLDPVS